MSVRGVLVTCVIAVFLVGATDNALAASPTETLRDFFAEGSRILKDPAVRDNPETGLAAVRRLVDRLLDARRAASQALGSEWDRRTAQERREFEGLFAGFIERSYLAQLVARVRGQGEVRVTYLDESTAGDTAIVNTTLTVGAASAIPFQYRMTRSGDRWTVNDVVVDGVSLVDNYRAQFQRVMSRVSFTGLLKLLREKSGLLATAAEAAPPAPQPAQAPQAAPVAQAAPALTPVEPVASTPPIARPAAPAAAEGPGPLQPAPAAPASASAAADKAYWVQIGAFRDPDAAQRLIQRLRSLPTALSTTAASLWRVRVGPFVDRASALSTLRRLERQGFRPFLAEPGS